MAEVKTGEMLDAIKTQKLKAALNRVPARTLRIGFQGILGGGDKVKGALNSIVRQIEKKPKIALKKWAKAVEEIKHGLLFDACRTEKLKSALHRVPRRLLKDSLMRVVGGNNKVAGALRSIKHSIEKRPAEAMKKWKIFVLNCHRGKVLDALRAFKLSACMNKIPKRTIRDARSRIE